MNCKLCKKPLYSIFNPCSDYCRCEQRAEAESVKKCLMSSAYGEVEEKK